MKESGTYKLAIGVAAGMKQIMRIFIVSIQRQRDSERPGHVLIVQFGHCHTRKLYVAKRETKISKIIKCYGCCWCWHDSVSVFILDSSIVVFYYYIQRHTFTTIELSKNVQCSLMEQQAETAAHTNSYKGTSHQTQIYNTIQWYKRYYCYKYVIYKHLSL